MNEAGVLEREVRSVDVPDIRALRVPHRRLGSILHAVFFRYLGFNGRKNRT
jgi:hypothetical protein